MKSSKKQNIFKILLGKGKKKYLKFLKLCYAFDEYKFFEDVNYDYKVLDNRTVEIIKYKGKNSNIVVPSEIENKKVISIGSFAFSECVNLKEIIIPNGITTIEEGAFFECIHLENVVISGSVISIGYGSFGDTAWYNNQPDGLIYAGKVVYMYKGDMPKNTSINIKNGTLGIAESAFYGCTKLASITIPDSVTTIGDFAFDDCCNMTVYGYKSSYAETYANANNIPFVLIEETNLARVL